MYGLFKKLVTKMYRNESELIDNSFRKSQDYFILQIIFTTMFSILTGGVYLAGFAVYLKASDILIGYISILPNLCGILMFAGGAVVERFHNKKKVVILLVVVSKTIICSVILIPFYVPQKLQGGVLFLLLAIAFTLQGLNGVVTNNWLISILPNNIRGRYFAVRQSFSLAVSVALPLATGVLIDSFHDKYMGFLILFCSGLFMMIIELYTYVNIDEPQIEHIYSDGIKLYDMIVLPLKNREFTGYVLYMFVFYVILYISCSFTQVFLIRYLKLPYTFISLMLVFVSLLQILCYRVWGKICDTKGNSFVLFASIWFFIGDMFCWSLMSSGTAYVVMPIDYVFSAIANSGFAVGAFNRRYSIVPEKGRMLYDGFYSTAIGIAFLLGPFIGSIIQQHINSIDFVRNHIPFAEFRLLYMISCLGVVLLQVAQVIIRRLPVKPNAGQDSLNP